MIIGMSATLTTCLLLLGHFCFHGYFIPLLIFAFSCEFRRNLCEVKSADRFISKESMNHANFVVNRAVIFPVIIAGTLFAIFAIGQDFVALNINSFSLFEIDRLWLVSTLKLSRNETLSLLSGYISYLIVVSFSIMFRKTISVGIIDWVRAKVPETYPSFGFSNVSAIVFCLVGLILADSIVGFLAHLVFPPSADKRWFLVYCYLILPSGTITAIWLSAFGLNFVKMNGRN